MTDNKKNTGLKVIAILLVIALGATLFYTVSLYNQKKQTVSEISQERDRVLEDFNNLKVDYDRAIEDGKATNEDLIEARNKITAYIDSLNTMKSDVASLYRFRSQVIQLKKERDFLLAQNDSLKNSNNALRQQRDSSYVQLEKQSNFADSLVVQNTQLAKMVEVGSALNLTKVSIEAVKERSSGKLVSTTRSRRADKIKICYTVQQNTIAQPGAKQFYIQVTGPSGKILGDNAVAANEDNNNSVTYSKASSFYYENDDLDICDYLDKGSKEFEEGNYKVIIYDNKLRELATSTFTLK
ncbi:hypothetical protein ACG2LH_05750 [Zhouia sp. PK063]|uniref:hypothetical protein n=1 Tax=Zhouia sp. PK063 TaxID=3373602 RepID=UPI0037B34BD4